MSVAAATSLILLLSATASAGAQIPLSPPRDAGQSVTPAYEGWYPNPDGSYTLSFGYFNRNTEEVVEIPVGENNFIEPGAADQGQPTHFYPQRNWGVFTVRVPADFGEGRVIWTLSYQDQTYAIPGHLEADWLLDAKLDPASGNTPPQLRLDAEGPVGSGPDGSSHGPIAARVDVPLQIDVWVTDDEIGEASTFRPQKAPVVLAWMVHSGPGEVTFGETEPDVDKDDGGRATTTATFDTAGDYVLRVRANDWSGNVGGGHAQCCWTNGYLRVSVSD